MSTTAKATGTNGASPAMAGIVDPAMPPELQRQVEADLRRAWLTEPDPETFRGIFDDLTDQFTRYEVVVRFNGMVLGGIPKDPKLIQGWLKARAGMKDEAMIQMAVAQTMIEMGQAEDPQDAAKRLDQVTDQLAEQLHGCGFKRDQNGLYLESRQVKAGLKEATNILYAGDRWGRTKKGPKSFFSERVFVVEPRIYLGRSEPDGTLPFTGHVPSPTGDKSTLTFYEFCWQPTIKWTMFSTNDPRDPEAPDQIEPQTWQAILRQFEMGGLGALRSQSTGTFRVLKWTKLKPAVEVTGIMMTEEVFDNTETAGAAKTVIETAARRRGRPRKDAAVPLAEPYAEEVDANAVDADYRM